MKRVVLFIRSLGIGGAERQLTMLAKGLHVRGVDVRVLTFYPDGDLRAELESAGIGVNDLDKRGRWDLTAFFVRLVRYLRACRPDVLYSWMSTANIFAVLAGRFVGVPRIVWSVRESYVDTRHYGVLSRVDRSLARHLARWADRIVCNSESGRIWHEQMGYPPDRLAVVENGIDIERFMFTPEGRKRVREEWGVSDTECVLGMVARFDPMKDHATFLQAARLLASRNDGVRFAFVGDGPEAMRIRARAQQLGISDRIVWMGKRTDLPAVYSALDLVCSTSAFGEGFSNAIAEAMACERICVVTDVGDNARIIGDAGMVVPPKDPEAFAHAVERVLALAPRERKEREKAARMRIVSLFSVECMVERTGRELGLW